MASGFVVFGRSGIGAVFGLGIDGVTGRITGGGVGGGSSGDVFGRETGRLFGFLNVVGFSNEILVWDINLEKSRVSFVPVGNV
jgi:hypothetical protein